MTAVSIIIDIVLILVSIVLIVAVLMQQGQRQGLGAISGGAETFFGKSKARGIDAKLAKITKIAAAVFIVLAIAATIVVATGSKDAELQIEEPQAQTETVETEGAEAPAEETEAAEAPAEEAEAPTEEAEAPAEEAEAPTEAAEAADTSAEKAE